MANNHTQLHATDNEGSRLAIQHTSTDSPILPAENLARLKEIDPSLVSWVVQQTEIEAGHRRKETSHVNWFIFAERILGVILGAGVAILGLGAATYLALKGHDWVAAVVGGGTLATIVTVIVGYNKRNANEALNVKPTPRRPKKKS